MEPTPQPLQDPTKDPADKEKKKQIQIIVLGDGGSDKTAFIKRYQEEDVEAHITTLGLDFKSAKYQYNGENVHVKIWDTAG